MIRLEILLACLLLLASFPDVRGTVESSVQIGVHWGGETVVVDPCKSHKCSESEECVVFHHQLLQMPVAHCIPASPDTADVEDVCQHYLLASNVMNCRSQQWWRDMGQTQCLLRKEGFAALVDVEVEHACHQLSGSTPTESKFLRALFTCCPPDTVSTPSQTPGTSSHSPSTASHPHTPTEAPSTVSRPHTPTEAPSTVSRPHTPTEAPSTVSQPHSPTYFEAPSTLHPHTPTEVSRPQTYLSDPDTVSEGKQENTETSVDYPEDSAYTSYTLIFIKAALAVVLVTAFLAIFIAFVQRYCHNKHRSLTAGAKLAAPKDTYLINLHANWKENEEEEEEVEGEEGVFIWGGHDTSPILPRKPPREKEEEEEEEGEEGMFTWGGHDTSPILPRKPSRGH